VPIAFEYFSYLGTRTSMLPTAVEQARRRLKRVKAAVAKMQDKTTPPAEFEDAWTDLIMAAGSIYSKLEQGAKSNGVSNAWFGRMKHLRKNDELLSYIHHARNSDEHGLESGVQTFRGSRLQIVEGEGYEVVDDPKHPLSFRTKKDQPERLKIKLRAVEGEHAHLVRVKDERYGDEFDPPTTHLGKALEIRHPVAVGELALAYLESLIEEAAKLKP